MLYSGLYGNSTSQEMVRMKKYTNKIGRDNHFPLYKSLHLLFLIIATVFIRIVAAATINFSLAGVRLLIEGGSYSRTAFIYFGGIPLRRSGGILL